jgi:hypothetical protein
MDFKALLFWAATAFVLVLHWRSGSIQLSKSISNTNSNALATQQHNEQSLDAVRTEWQNQPLEFRKNPMTVGPTAEWNSGAGRRK